MFTSTFYRMTEVMCIISCILGSNCVLFSRKRKLFFTVKATRLWVKFTFSWAFAANIFMIFRSLEVKWRSNDIKKFNECYVLTLLWTLGCVALGVFASHPHESSYLLNQMMRFAINYKNKWIIKYDPKKFMCGDQLDRTIMTMTVAANLIAWLSVVIYCMDTNLPLYPHTILPVHLRDHIMVVTLVGVGILYVATTFAWLMVVLVAVGGSFLSVTVMVFTREFKAGRKTYATHDGLRHPFVLSVTYRICEILHNFFIDIGGLVLLPCQALISHFILIVNYMLLSYSAYLTNMDKVRLTLFTVIFQFGWFLVLEMGGRYYVNSHTMIKSLKYHKTSNDTEKKFLKKYAKSCRPMFIGTKGYFKIKRLTVLKFLRGIVKGTFSMVLASKDETF